MGPPQRAISPLLVAAVSLAAVAALLWRITVEPLDFGYLRYLGIADEMVRSGNWILLRLEDRLYLEKPPLFFWLIALPMAALGHAPAWVAHIPDLLALALSLFCIHRLGAAVFGRGEPALAGALIFATTWETFNQVSSRRIDALFAALLTAAFTALYLGAIAPREGRPRPRLVLLAWLFAGLATVTKGPLGVVFFVLVAGLGAAWTGRLRALASRASLAGVALLLAMAAAWPALLVWELGLERMLNALGATNLTTRTAGLLLYVRSLPIQSLPWSFFLPAGIAWLVQRRRWPQDTGIRFLLVWFVAIFAVLHLSGARHQRYLQPATPALSLLFVSLWYAPGGAASALPGLAAWLRGCASAVYLALLALLGAVAGGTFAFLDRAPLLGLEIPSERFIAAPVALATAAGAMLALRGLRRGGSAARSPLPLALLFLGVLTVFSLLAAGNLRSLDRIPLARAALAPLAAGEPAAMLGMDEEQHQMARLLTRRHLAVLRSAPEVVAWLEGQPGRAALILTDDAGRRELVSLGGLEIRIRNDFELAQEALELLEVRPGT